MCKNLAVRNLFQRRYVPCMLMILVAIATTHAVAVGAKTPLNSV